MAKVWLSMANTANVWLNTVNVWLIVANMAIVWLNVANTANM